MGGDHAPGGAPDERLPCCGHPWELHTPTCRYWYPGTKVDAPAECGCDGAGVPRDAQAGGDPLHSHAASAPAR